MKGVEFVEDSGAKTSNEEVSQGWVERLSAIVSIIS